MYISHNSSIRLLTLLSFIIILFKRALRIRGGGGVWVARPGVWRMSGSVGDGRADAPVAVRAGTERSNYNARNWCFRGKLNNSTRIRLSDSKIGMYICQYLYILVLCCQFEIPIYRYFCNLFQFQNI